MKPFLYLDNWHKPQPETRFDRALADRGLKVLHLRTNDGEFPDGTAFCGAYVSPSFNAAYDKEPWIHEEHAVLRRLAEARVPILGLCFGSQILASSLCGRDQVVLREERERGYGSITLTDAARTEDPLTRGMPETVPVLHWHEDEVRAGHPDAQVLAFSSECANQIWRWRLGPVWGVQPHPEFDRCQAIEWFTANRAQFAAGGLDYDKLATEADDNVIAARLIDNFLSYAIDTSA